jgi:xylan 1,4-beta-xylosidase
MNEWADVTSRPGWLRLRGRRSLESAVGVSLLASRVQALPASYRSTVEAWPHDPRQRAGLVCWYDRRGHHGLWLTGGESGRHLVVATTDTTGYREEHVGIEVSDWPQVHLRLDVDGLTVRFLASRDGGHWTPAGEPLDAAVVSDDYPGPLRFTGAMAALGAVDTGGGTFTADFTSFTVVHPSRE